MPHWVVLSPAPALPDLLPLCPASGAGIGLGECADGFAGSQSDGETYFGFSSATSVAFPETSQTVGLCVFRIFNFFFFILYEESIC